MAEPPPPVRRVRAVVVDLDGGDRLVRCVRALLATAWDGDLEVVVVDNGSHVPSADRLADEPGVRVVRVDRNLGFAGGANRGITPLDGLDAVALVNNDMVVPPGWLTPLAGALDADAGVAAACPKIRFAGRYRLLVVAPEREVLLHAVEAAGAVRADPAVPAPSGDGVRPLAGPASFWVADGPGPVRLQLSAQRPTAVRVDAGDATAVVEADRESRWVEVSPTGAATALVNNVGTGWRDDGYGYDLGYLEPDGAAHAGEHDIDAWSGGGVLLRAEHLRAVGGFDERLFLYYEDLDLALRGRAAGARFRLVPASVLDHEHSATAVSGSPFAEYHKERNRVLVVLRHRGWGAALRAALGLVRGTLGYLRRDVLVALVRRRRPSFTIVAYRLKALGGAVRRAPAFRPGSRP